MRALAIAIVIAAARASAEPCESVPIWKAGRHLGDVCRDDAARRGLTVVDLGESWVPRFLGGDDPPSYVATYRALAQERFALAPSESLAPGDRYLELYGIEPTLGVVRARLTDDVRHRCHAEIDDRALVDAPTLVERAVDGDGEAAAIRAVQAHLACDGLFLAAPVAGSYTWQTANAVMAFQRAVMALPTGTLDSATRDALLLDSRERDFRTALRVLRERVVDATGLVEDGTARGEVGTVLGRPLDPAATWRVPGYPPVAGAAPDRISPATEAAARALGWTSPDAFRKAPAPALVAIALPPLPTYHTPAMDLTVEIDRGDVWIERVARTHESSRSPALTLFASDGERRIALARWPTTIGGWQDQQLDDVVVQQWKESPVGPRIWRDLYVAPRWLPPASTPVRELVRETDSGTELNREVYGPSYRSAFGLLAFVHASERDLDDEGIRTHGTGNLRSLERGASHGCHRLLGVFAMRLADFVLAHRAFVRHGDEPAVYRRVIHEHGAFPIAIDTLGYRIELTPPIRVVVLPGRVHRP